MLPKTPEREKTYLQQRWEPVVLRLQARARLYRLLSQGSQLAMIAGAVALLTLLAVPELPRSLLALVAGVITGAAAVNVLFRFDDQWRSTQTLLDALRRARALYEAGVAPYQDAASAFTRFVETCEQWLAEGKPLPRDSMPESSKPAAPPAGATPAPSSSSPFGSRFTPAPRMPGSGSGSALASLGSRPPTPPPRHNDDDELDDDDEDDDSESSSGGSSRFGLSGTSPFSSRYRSGDSPFSRSAFGAPASRSTDLRSRLGGSDLGKGDERDADLSHVKAGGSNGGSGVQFAVNYPKEMRAEQWQPLHAYAYLGLAAEEVANDVRRQNTPGTLFKRAPGTRHTLPEGALVTVIPCLKGFQFNPSRVAIGFYKDWHRFDFEMRAVAMRLDEAANGYISFLVDGVLVADLPLSVYVSKHGPRDADTMRMIVRKPYRDLYASYSPRDTQIAERVLRVSEALGMYPLRDVAQVKMDPAGQTAAQPADRDTRLQLIEQADVFQLFWSHDAAESDEVREEWQYALARQRRGGQQADSLFIRAVYWQQPIPPLPEELRHVPLLYQPELGR